MTKIDIREDKLALWIVCEAIGKDRHFIDKMIVDENGLRDVVFSVGGVELDFNNVIKRIDEIYDDAVERRAKKLLDERYESLVGDIIDIQERLKEHKTAFKYEWE